jgi:hypothetical protein
LPIPCGDFVREVALTKQIIEHAKSQGCRLAG